MRICYKIILLFCLISEVAAVEIADIPLDIPDPMYLKPNWGSYFNGAGDELQKKIDALYKQLDQLKNQLPMEIQESGQLFIARIRGNINALLKLRNQKVDVPVVFETFHESYSLDQQLVLFKQLQLEKRNLEREKKEWEWQKEKQKNLQGHIDRLFAAYLKMENKSQEKLITGFEIISLEIALALTKEQSRLMDERIDYYGHLIPRLNQELDYAEDHLNLTELNSSKINIKMSDLTKKYHDAKDATIRSEMDAMSFLSVNGEGKGKHYLLAQKVLTNRVTELLILTQLRLEEIKLLFLEASNQDFAVIDQKISSYKKELGIFGVRHAEIADKVKQEEERIRHLVLNKQQKEISPEMIELIEPREDEIDQTLAYLDSFNEQLNQERRLIDQFQLYLYEIKPSYWLWWMSFKEYINNCCTPLIDWMNTSLVKIGGIPLTPLSLFQVLCIIVFTFLISSFVRTILRSVTKRHQKFSQSSLFILNRLVHYAILLIGIAVAFSSIGLNLSNFAIILGALSVGIGFGLQSIVQNFFSSLIILFSRSLRVGDYIELENGDWGQATAINVQNTIIHTWDGVDIVVPNSQMIAHRFTNWTMRDGYRRFHIPFGVHYGADKELICKVVKEASYKVPCTVSNHNHLDEPNVWLVKFGENALEFELVVWVNMYSRPHKGSIVSSYYWEIHEALREQQISIPFPQRVVHVKSEMPV